MDYTKHVSTKSSPQMERTPGRTDEVVNSAGGYVFPVDNWTRLDRFLILGSEGGTYYTSERELTKDNAAAVISLIKSDGLRVVARTVEISKAGRAPSNDPALFVLALAAKLGDEATRQMALNVMPSVARIGTHLFTFAKYLQAFGGWGRATKRAFARWYNQKTPDQLANQLLKYRQRNGWSHRDILRLAHPKTGDEQRKLMYDVTCRPEKLKEAGALVGLPGLFTGYATAAVGDVPQDGRAALVKQFQLSREMLPTEWLKDSAIWEAMLPDMPYIATVRNLGVMSANGTLKPLSVNTKTVVARILDREQLKGSRIHPLNLLVASKIYEQGRGMKGSLSWSVDKKIVDALDEAFYLSFDNVEPTGKNYLLGVDVSGSMSGAVAGSPISCAQAAAAIALVLTKTEPNTYVHGFTAGDGSYYTRKTDVKGFVDLKISTKDSLPDALRKVHKANFGATDCAIPMLYATANKLDVDCFIVLTDNETWAGSVKPTAALQQYRRQFNPKAKLVVVGMTSTGFTIADPTDAGQMDIVGFDPAIPTVVADFVRS